MRWMLGRRSGCAFIPSLPARPPRLPILALFPQKLLAGTTGADLPTLLSLQSALVSSLNALLLTRVDTPHYTHFDEIWLASGLEDVDEHNRWRRLGFRTESPQFEFDAVGLLGLKALARYAMEDQNEFAQVRTLDSAPVPLPSSSF
jgi:hypothetical protein